MLLISATLAVAEPVFLAAEAAFLLDIGGNWPKVYADPAGGYHVLNATQGVYNYQHADDALIVDGATREVLTTDRDWLQDHGVAQRPDGTYLHIASASLVEHDDSAYAYLYDESFNLLKSEVLVEGRVGQWWNDMPVVCGETFRGLGYYDQTNNYDLMFVELDEDLHIVQEVRLNGAPIALGASFLEEDGLLKVVGAPNKDRNGIIYAAFDADYQPVERLEVANMPEGWYPYWTQGFVRYGDYYLIAHLAQDTAYTWNTQGGDLWVQAFDLDWNPVDQLQLTANTAPVGGLQPFLSVFGDTLHAIYSKEQTNYLYRVQLAEIPEDTDTDTDADTDTDTDADTDTDTDADTDADTGSETDPDTDTDTDTHPDSGADTGDDGGPSPTGGCGCAAPAGAPAPALVLAAVLARRRR